MNEIIAFLEQSIDDELFSKPERKSLKRLLGDRILDRDELNFLRSKVFEIANRKATESNYRFILEWVRNATNSLMPLQWEGKSAGFFSPGDACRDVIMNQIQSATKRINICVFTISDDLISDSIIQAHRKGTEVQIITDDDKAADVGSDIERITRMGIAVKMDKTPNHMHHKFMVVDDLSLITGSYNWTRSAAKFNHENILLTQEPGVVRSFLKEFGSLWKGMEYLRLRRE